MLQVFNYIKRRSLYLHRQVKIDPNFFYIYPSQIATDCFKFSSLFFEKSFDQEILMFCWRYPDFWLLKKVTKKMTAPGFPSDMLKMQLCRRCLWKFLRIAEVSCPYYYNLLPFSSHCSW